MLPAVPPEVAAPLSPGGRLAQWLDRHPEASYLPPHMGRVAEALSRDDEIARAWSGAKVVPAAYTRQRQTLHAELTADLARHGERRDAEQRLARYIRDVAAEGSPVLLEVAAKLESCRVSGAVGLKPSGGYVVAYDDKCGLSRLCPDEANAETARLAERYVPHLAAWLAEKPGRSIHYAVLTWHNFAPGRLAHGKRYLMERFKAEILDGRDAACPVAWAWSAEAGRRVTVATRKRTIERFPEIRGAFVCQEDPLSAGREWNVHQNVVLMVEGYLDYGRLRDAWGANLHVQRLEGSPESLTRALREVVKYSAQAVPSKSADKRARHATEAPAMVEWPGALWREWWDAQAGFRRTRTYGACYRVPKVEPELEDFADVFWCGQLHFDARTRSFRIDLIPGDNFSGSRAAATPGDNRARGRGRPPDPPDDADPPAWAWTH